MNPTPEQLEAAGLVQLPSNADVAIANGWAVRKYDATHQNFPPINVTTEIPLYTSANWQTPKNPMIPPMAVTLSGYTTTRSTSFAGLTKLPSDWYAYSGQPGGDPDAQWSASNILFGANFLSLLTTGPTKLPSGDEGYTSAGIGCNQSQVDGRTDVCIRFPSNCAGMSFIALLWPNSGTWPAAGESDFVETGGASPITGFNATEHYGTQNTNPQVHTPASLSIDWSAFNVWSIESSPGLRVYRVNDQVWGTMTNTDFVSDARNLDFQAQWLGEGTPITPCPFDIAWAVQYQPS